VRLLSSDPLGPQDQSHQQSPELEKLKQEQAESSAQWVVSSWHRE
jgi:hypothetical protein